MESKNKHRNHFHAARNGDRIIVERVFAFRLCFGYSQRWKRYDKKKTPKKKSGAKKKFVIKTDV